MNAIHGGTGTLVEKRPVVEEQKKTVAGGPLNVRNFNLLFGGQTNSVIGVALYLVALPTLVHGPLHGNASTFGIILVAWGAGAFVGAIIAGALGKRKKGSSCLLRVCSWPP